MLADILNTRGLPLIIRAAQRGASGVDWTLGRRAVRSAYPGESYQSIEAAMRMAREAYEVGRRYSQARRGEYSPSPEVVPDARRALDRGRRALGQAPGEARWCTEVEISIDSGGLEKPIVLYSPLETISMPTLADVQEFGATIGRSFLGDLIARIPEALPTLAGGQGDSGELLTPPEFTVRVLALTRCREGTIVSP